jgi:hypothetical protein
MVAKKYAIKKNSPYFFITIFCYKNTPATTNKKGLAKYNAFFIIEQMSLFFILEQCTDILPNFGQLIAKFFNLRSHKKRFVGENDEKSS